MNENDEDELIKRLAKQADDLAAEIAQIKKLDVGSLVDSMTSRGRSSDAPRFNPRKVVRPDWVVDYNRKNGTQAARVIVEAGQLKEPVLLPEDKRLDKLHDDRKVEIPWDQRPTHDGVAPHGLSKRDAIAWEAANRGNPLRKNLEGATKPVREQMTRLGRVWKYRNFQYCRNCSIFYSQEEAENMGTPDLAGKLKKGTFDTWEARSDPNATGAVGAVHAEIWCQTCGATEFEVSPQPPANVGCWAPAKETEKERLAKAANRAYREAAALLSLAESPKTTWELMQWFRGVQKYDAVDPVILGSQLSRMRRDGKVELVGDKWQIKQQKGKKK